MSVRRRALVHSEDEIPQHFGSEDEEREWWATHDLSARFLRESRPRYSDLWLFLPIRAAQAPSVRTLLDVAGKHTALAERNPERHFAGSDVRLEHAYISIIFSAAAIEAALTLYELARAGGLGEDTKHRRSTAAPTPPGADYRAQLEAIHADSMGVGSRKSLVPAVQRLLARRDYLVHGVATPPESSETREPSRDDVRVARRSYEAAVKFLDGLILSTDPS